MIEKLGITKEELERLEQPEVQKEIAEIVLQDIGKADLYNLTDLQDVRVYFVDTKEGERVVVLLDLGQENNLVAIYTEDGNVYEYVAELDLFYQVNDILFLPIATQDKNAIIVNEYVNQGLGAYEFSELIRGYVLENDIYRQVLSVEGNVDSFWNRKWDNPDSTNPNQWEQIQQIVTTNWTTDAKGNPLLHLVKEQTFLEAKGNISNTVPLEDEFTQSSNRTIKETYFWSDDWNQFILGEAIEKSTQQVVAIIEIRDNSPYALAGFVDNTFIVLDEAGDMRMVEGSDLLQIIRKTE